MPRGMSKTQLAVLLFAAATRTVEGVRPEALQTVELEGAHKHLSGYVPLEDSCGGRCRLVARETSAIAVRSGGHMQKVKRSSLARANSSAAALEGGCRPGDETWGKDAGGHPCGSRIEWVVRNTDADTYDKAKDIVASQFLEICAPCHSHKSPTPAPTPPTIGHTATGEPCLEPSSTPSGPVPSPASPSPGSPAPATGVWTPDTNLGEKKTCEEQSGNDACSGQFGNQECHTCKERIDYLSSRGKSVHDAREIVGKEFLSDCGGCTKLSEITLGTGYKVVMRDDFDGDKLDLTKWKYYTGRNFNNERQQYTDREKNSPVSDGTLKITAFREKFSGDAGNMDFTAARIDSKESWLYGRFSFKARMLNSLFKGTWPALWMMPTESKYGEWPRSGEMDIMENVGYEGNQIHGTPHTDAYNHIKKSQRGGHTKCDIKEWHVYTIEWTPDRLLWALDSKVYHIFSKESNDIAVWPFNQDFYLIMNFAVGGNWGAARGFDDSKWDGTQMLEVDWAQVEQKA